MEVKFLEKMKGIRRTITLIVFCVFVEFSLNDGKI